MPKADKDYPLHANAQLFASSSGFACRFRWDPHSILGVPGGWGHDFSDRLAFQ